MRLNKGIVQSAIEEFALSEDELKKVREDFKNEITLPPCPPSEKGALKSIPLRGGRPKGDVVLPSKCCLPFCQLPPATNREHISPWISAARMYES